MVAQEKMLASLLCMAFLQRAPTVRLGNGQAVSLHGDGPPVVFSSGLYGLMPRRIYTQLFEELASNLTLVVLDDAAPVTRETVECVADELAVTSVGVLSHSSLDAGILASARVHRAVCCDPVVGPLARPAQTVDVLTLKAEAAFGPEAPFPGFLLPSGEAIDFPGMGHADLLDDVWAELAPRAFPWMTSVRGPVREFWEWTRETGRAAGANAARRDYRATVARHAVRFLLHDESDISTSRTA